MGGIPEHLKFHGKEGALKIQKREGSTAHVKSQRKQEMGLDPGHSEKTRGCGVFSGRDMEDIIGRRNSMRQVRGRKKHLVYSRIDH